MTDAKSSQLLNTAAVTPEETLRPRRAARRRSTQARRASVRRTVQAVAIWSGSIAALVVVVAALLFQAHGGRWFIVETPSMGTTAPVGTLVLSSPVKVDALKVGDIITFHPPTDSSETYTHRIVAIYPGTGADAGISTRGDINGATDPWRLHQTNIVGKITAVLPVVGWIVRAVPLLLVGFVVVMLLTRLIRTPNRRVSYRILGFSLLSSLTVYMLKPFVGIVVLTTNAVSKGVNAQVVSTGILPITVSAAHGTHVNLAAGQVGTITVPSIGDVSHYSLSSALHLTLLEWILFGAICSIPLLWTLIVGIPAPHHVDRAEAAA